MIPLLYALSVWQGKIQFAWNERIQGKNAGLTGHLSEILSNLPLVKEFCAEEWEKKRGNHWIHQLFQVNISNSLITNLLLQLKNLASLLHTTAMIGLGLWMISHNEITLDIWVAFYLYSQNLLNSFSRIMSIWGTVKSSQGAVRRITELMAEQTEPDDPCTGSDGMKGDILFENVSFSYENQPVLKNLTFTAPEGKTTALVGPSGAGKTTVFQLLERFYSPDQGSIRMGKTDIFKLPLVQWRRMIGYGPRALSFFRNDPRKYPYGIHRPVTEQELLQAIEDSQCSDFYTCHAPRPYDPDRRSGSGLSGGQRQRISLARLFLQNPKILLLDEVTANLDPESEYRVEQALARIRKGRTTFVIAHRTSAVKDVDEIILLNSRSFNTPVPERSL